MPDADDEQIVDGVEMDAEIAQKKQADTMSEASEAQLAASIDIGFTPLRDMNTTLNSNELQIPRREITIAANASASLYGPATAREYTPTSSMATTTRDGSMTARPSTAGVRTPCPRVLSSKCGEPEPLLV